MNSILNFFPDFVKEGHSPESFVITRSGLWYNGEGGSLLTGALAAGAVKPDTGYRKGRQSAYQQTGGYSMTKFIELEPGEIKGNVFDIISREWMLITAGKENRFNTMTASWGGLGVLWNTPVSFAFVRPSRYTYEFLEQEKYYTLSVLEPGNKKALQICGSKSGRDTDKVTEAGLTPVFDAQAPYFQQARLVLVCRKLYTQDLDPQQFLDPAIMGNYKNGDFHRVYVGEIVKVLQRV